MYQGIKNNKCGTLLEKRVSGKGQPMVQKEKLKRQSERVWKNKLSQNRTKIKVIKRMFEMLKDIIEKQINLKNYKIQELLKKKCHKKLIV